jgi:predicted HD superfamily hydrolase involved in NAD metabolism
VAREARDLARRFGFDEERAFAAGLGHDVARELDGAEILRAAGRGGVEPTAAERERPLLLHGVAGAVLLQERGLTDPVILAAVRSHVGGGPGLDAVSKAVYAADLLEPGRRFARGLRRRSRAAASGARGARDARGASLDAIVLLVAETLAAYHSMQGLEPLPATRLMIEELRRKGR